MVEWGINMKLKLKQGREYQNIELKNKGNLYEVINNDNINSFNLDFISKNVLLFKKNNKFRHLTYTIKNNIIKLYSNGKEYSFDFLDEKAIRRLSSTGALNAGGPVVIDSPMPGKIVKLLKSVGDKVKEGEAIMIMEAMKMENEMKAPYDGVINKIFVNEGDTLESGVELFGIE